MGNQRPPIPEFPTLIDLPRLQGKRSYQQKPGQSWAFFFQCVDVQNGRKKKPAGRKVNRRLTLADTVNSFADGRRPGRRLVGARSFMQQLQILTPGIAILTFATRVPARGASGKIP